MSLLKKNIEILKTLKPQFSQSKKNSFSIYHEIIPSSFMTESRAKRNRQKYQEKFHHNHANSYLNILIIIAENGFNVTENKINNR